MCFPYIIFILGMNLFSQFADVFPYVKITFFFKKIKRLKGFD